jgi:hypothetical protein
MAEIWEAIRPYSGWIIFGVFLLLMMRMHTGGGCGMGHGAHGQGTPRESIDDEPTNRSADRRAAAGETNGDEPERQAVAGRRSGGCH